MEDARPESSREASQDPALSPAEEAALIEQIAARLAWAAAAGDKHAPETWRRAARKLGCEVDPYRDPTLQSFGHYSPDPDTPGTGLLRVNTAQPPEVQVPVLVRLLAYHVRYHWIPATASE